MAATQSSFNYFRLTSGMLRDTVKLWSFSLNTNSRCCHCSFLVRLNVTVLWERSLKKFQQHFVGLGFVVFDNISFLFHVFLFNLPQLMRVTLYKFACFREFFYQYAIRNENKGQKKLVQNTLTLVLSLHTTSYDLLLRRHLLFSNCCFLK